MTEHDLKIRLCVNAATGKMGQQIIYQLTQKMASSTKAELSSAFCRSAHPFFNKVVRGSENIYYTDQLNSGLKMSQVVIDFSLPSVSLALLKNAVETNTAVLIGTTGFSKEQLDVIKLASQQIPILLAPNTSIGVNVTFALLEKAAKLLNDDANIEIIEAHHKHKLDAPSGTALKMAEVICDATNTQLEERAVYNRNNTNKERSENEIGFSVIRAGEIIGEHKVMFALNNEIISIEHKAQSRTCFAEGAIKAATWLAKQESGFYSMQDFLNSQ